ncbi:ATP-binding cassette domain-containing protein [Pseudoalteromonas piscicida]|uniref:ATP-binding cassette domain-containing protein n=1 Tax=Pseudoalteromonas piscicida TaxID=43662 RepID=UPI001CB815DF|nr:ATP-binding cassette domain-containing protein [Pseudoalteromonas piscicida]
MMPWIQVKQASLTLANGQCLFCDVDLTIERQFIAVTGPNGAGKSHLLKVLSGEQPLTSGERQSHGKCFYLPQDATNRFTTVSELLGLKEKLVALHRAHQGLASEHDFDLISDDWQLESSWQATLAPLELTLETPLQGLVQESECVFILRYYNLSLQSYYWMSRAITWTASISTG